MEVICLAGQIQALGVDLLQVLFSLDKLLDSLLGHLQSILQVLVYGFEVLSVLGYFLVHSIGDDSELGFQSGSNWLHFDVLIRKLLNEALGEIARAVDQFLRLNSLSIADKRQLDFLEEKTGHCDAQLFDLLYAGPVWGA